MARYGVVFCLAFLLASAASYAAGIDQVFNIRGGKILHDESTDDITITKAKIATARGGQLITDSVKFNLPQGKTHPYVALLGTNTSLGERKLNVSFADGSRFYPELSSIVSKSITISTTSEYSCKAGKLLHNGVPMNVKSVCVGSGYIISCSGNEAIFYVSDQACPL